MELQSLICRRGGGRNGVWLHFMGLMKTNPGSVASVVAIGQENSFQRLFVSYGAAIYGFMNGCRPLIELDRVHLKGKYLGNLFCAAAVDAEDQIFPLAIAVVDVESDENWMWFVSELRKLLVMNTETMPRLTILSERTLAMVEAVETHFPSAFHGFCLRFVSETFRDTFKNSKMMNIFWNAAYALTMTEFEAKISELAQITQDVMPWLDSFNPQLWAVACFQGVRYYHFTITVTEFLHAWVLDCHELHIVQMMEHMHNQIASWFNERLSSGLQLASTLAPSAEKQVSEAISDARCYEVLRANEVEFEIISSERTNIVDIKSRVCSCCRWQLYGVPCAHAAAALILCGHNVSLFADACFTAHSYRETYSQMINPIPDRSFWKETNDGSDIIPIRPPKRRRPPGRPKKTPESLKRPRRVVECGRCHMIGHSQKKCSLSVL